MSPTSRSSSGSWKELHRYTYVERPYEDVWYWLASHYQTIGAPLEGGGRSLELRVRPGGIEVSRPVRLHLSGLVCSEERARLGVGWADADHPHLFPELDGVLELAPVPNDGRPFTQLGLLARYRPPLGLLGAIGDRLVGAEVADAALTTFLEELARSAEEQIDPPALVPDPAAPRPAPPDGSDVRRTFLTIDGLGVRPGGAVGAGKALAATPGVVQVSLDPWNGLTAVDYDPTRCSGQQLVRALGEATPGPAA